MILFCCTTHTSDNKNVKQNNVVQRHRAMTQTHIFVLLLMVFNKYCLQLNKWTDNLSFNSAVSKCKQLLDLQISASNTNSLMPCFLMEPTAKAPLDAICVQVSSLQLPAIFHHEGPHRGLDVNQKEHFMWRSETFDTNTCVLIAGLSDPACFYSVSHTHVLCATLSCCHDDYKGLNKSQEAALLCLASCSLLCFWQEGGHKSWNKPAGKKKVAMQSIRVLHERQSCH